MTSLSITETLTSEIRDIKEVENAPETIQILAGRHYLYTFFQRVFAQEPDDVFLEQLCGDVIVQAAFILEEFVGEQPGGSLQPSLLQNDFLRESLLQQGLSSLLVSTQKTLSTQLEKSVDELKSEYTRLFIGPTALVAPPWESVYRSKSSAIFQKTTLDVRRVYLEHGLIPQEHPRIADDHLSLELDFMKTLSRRVLSCLEQGKSAECHRLLEAQVAFLDQHLLKWVEEFAQRILADEYALFYPKLAQILVVFLFIDRAVMECIDG